MSTTKNYCGNIAQPYSGYLRNATEIGSAQADVRKHF
jgi:hypothetical protein